MRQIKYKYDRNLANNIISDCPIGLKVCPNECRYYLNHKINEDIILCEFPPSEEIEKLSKEQLIDSFDNLHEFTEKLIDKIKEIGADENTISKYKLWAMAIIWDWKTTKENKPEAGQ